MNGDNMNEKVLVVRCDGYGHFQSLMRRLHNSIYTFRWDEGQLPLNYDPYKDYNYLNDMTIYICIEKNRTISYIINGESLEGLRKDERFYKLLNANDSMVMSKIHQFTNETVSKKSFLDLKCSDFRTCGNCPINLESCGFINQCNKTFGELKNELDQKFEELKRTYNKGDK